MDLMYSIAWTRYTNFPRSAERGNSRSTRWRHRFYGEPGNIDDWRRGYWTMAQIRANDEQVLTTQSTTCLSQLMMMTKIFNEEAMMAWIQWYSRIDTDMTSLMAQKLILRQQPNQNNQSSCKWFQKLYSLSKHCEHKNLELSQRNLI